MATPLTAACAVERGHRPGLPAHATALAVAVGKSPGLAWLDDRQPVARCLVPEVVALVHRDEQVSCPGSRRGRSAHGCRWRRPAGRSRPAGTTPRRPTARTSACSGRTARRCRAGCGRRGRARARSPRRPRRASVTTCAATAKPLPSKPVYASTRSFERRTACRRSTTDRVACAGPCTTASGGARPAARRTPCPVRRRCSRRWRPTAGRSSRTPSPSHG